MYFLVGAITMERGKRELTLYFAVIVLWQIVFLLAFTVFHDYVTAGALPFHKTSYEEWNWLIQREKLPDEAAVITAFTLLKLCALAVFLVGLYRALFFGRFPYSPSPAAKLTLTGFGFLAYLPCFYYIRCRAARFHLFMDLAPVEFLSLLLLTLLLFGIRRQSK